MGARSNPNSIFWTKVSPAARCDGPALERLRDLAYSGVIDRLYVHSPDRLARKYVYQVVLMEEFNKHDVEVMYLNDIAGLDSPEGNLLMQMQGMIAEYERAKILERTRRGRRFAAQQGKVSRLGARTLRLSLRAQANGLAVKRRYECDAEGQPALGKRWF